MLGATGNVGAVAVQAAKLLGAGRVVGVGRDEARLQELGALGADAVVSLAGDDVRERLAAAIDGSPPTLVFDALWGTPLEAALAVAAPGARIVHVGQSAGPTATIVSGLVRGKQLQIIGYTNFAVPDDAIATGTPSSSVTSPRGASGSTSRRIALADVADAWTRQQAGPTEKLVLVP